MVLPIPEWPRRDPQYRGLFDFTIDPEIITIGAGGYTDVEVLTGPINLIYRMRVSPTNPVGYSIQIYDRAARAVDDLIWQKAPGAVDYNSVESEDGVIVAVDKDKVADAAIHFRFSGTVAEVLTLNLDLLRVL